MEFIEYLENGLLRRARELIESCGPPPSAANLRAMESAVLGMTSVAGQAVLGEWLPQQDAKYPADTVACACGGQAHYERRREAVAITLQGQ